MTLATHTGSRNSGRPGNDVSNSAFSALGLSSRLVKALAMRDILEPFPVQELTIPDALAGRDVCGKAQTGSGKTLAFGLPLVQRTQRAQPYYPEALVLVPTRELASQVVAELAPLAASSKLRILAVYGGVSLERQAKAIKQGVDIIVATPGRLNDLLERGDVSVADVSMVVLDEADQMADMGFLPQVERILSKVEVEHQTLLFSATLDGDVDRLVRRYQHDPVYHEVTPPAEELPTMQHRFVGVEDANRVAVAAEIAAGPGRTLMFVRTQRGAKRLVRQLDIEGVGAGMLHGGMSQPQRERSLRAFSTGSIPVLVATNIAARGIHVDGVDIVVHHDPPEDAKTYLHRSGRTARAGATGVVVTLVSREQVRDVNVLRREAKLHQAIVSMEPGDPRLGDLPGWTPPEEDPGTAPRQGSRPNGNNSGRRGGGNRGGGGSRGGGGRRFGGNGGGTRAQGEQGARPRR